MKKSKHKYGWQHMICKYILSIILLPFNDLHFFYIMQNAKTINAV